MNKIVISKFNSTFWLKAIFFTLFVFGSVIACISISIKDWDSYNWGQLTIVAIFSGIVIYLYLKFMLASLMTITVAPGGLGIKYWLSGKSIVIDYADITHVSNDRLTSNRDTAFQSSYLMLTIKLTTGEEIVFSENLFNNYDELKDTIRDYRFLK